MMKTKIVALIMLCMMAMTLMGGVPVVASGTNILPGDSTNTFAAEVFAEGETMHEIESGATFNNGTWTCSYDTADANACCIIYPNGKVKLNRGGSDSTKAIMTSAAFPATKGAAYKLSLNMNMTSSSAGGLSINIGVWNKSNTSDNPSYPSVLLFSRSVPGRAKEHWDTFFVLPDSYNADRIRLQFVADSKSKPFEISNLTLTRYTGDEFVWYANELQEDFYYSAKYCNTSKHLTSHTAVTNINNTYVTPVAGKTYTVTKALPDIAESTDESAILLAAQYKGNPTMLNKLNISSAVAPVQLNGFDYVRKLTITGVQTLADSESFRILNWNNLAEMVPLS